MSDTNQNKGNIKSDLDPAERGVSPGKPDPCDELLGKFRDRVLPVSLNPAQVKPDCSDPDYIEVAAISRFIKETRIDFNCYKKVMDDILNEHYNKTGSAGSDLKRRDMKGLCDEGTAEERSTRAVKFLDDLKNSSNPYGAVPLFTSTKAYSILDFATEKFVHLFFDVEPKEIIPDKEVIPYVGLIEAKLGEICCKCDTRFRPVFGELIWNYWMEEGMLVNTINAIARRFQNKRSETGPDPLANLTIDPLRPINNLIWDYIQEAHTRLTVRRRSFEYDHQYGVKLLAAGGMRMNTADSRSAFIQAFHNLLYKCSLFYREADNLMKVPDAFPVLNALREVHLILSEGADNQFGELPVTARKEMLVEQYILSRPEIREFLGGRVMVPYDEAWMDRVDSMKTLQGWPGASISYFRDLAVFGEEIILSIRWISWSQKNNRDFAREWALLFRDAIQRYIHCYQAVTGVDLSAIEVAGGLDAKAAMPAYLIRRKALQAMRR